MVTIDKSSRLFNFISNGISYSLLSDEYSLLYPFMLYKYMNTTFVTDEVVEIYSKYDIVYTGINTLDTTKTNSIDQFLHNLKTGANVVSYRFKVKGEYQVIIGFCNTILDPEGKILASVVVKNYNHLFEDYNTGDYIGTVGEKMNLHIEQVENLELWVSLDFANNPIYKNVYKKYYENLVVPAIEEGISFSIKTKKELNSHFYKDIFQASDIHNIEDKIDYINSTEFSLDILDFDANAFIRKLELDLETTTLVESRDEVKIALEMLVELGDIVYHKMTLETNLSDNLFPILTNICNKAYELDRNSREYHYIQNRIDLVEVLRGF